jgi:hypothetical protein
MANIFPNTMRDDLLKAVLGDLSSAGVTVKAALIDSGTVAPSASHQFFSSISTAVVGTPQTVGSKTVGSLGTGIFDGADVTFTAVSGASVEYICVYIDTGSNATSKIIAYIDQVSSGLPVTPNGGNINIVWDATNGIIKLG